MAIVILILNSDALQYSIQNEITHPARTPTELFIQLAHVISLIQNYM